MMKRFITIAGFMLLAVMAMAQYEPNTKWPYLYSDFTEGTAYSSDNTKSALQMNVHLAGNVLHYIGKDGKIYRAADNKISRVEIGEDVYIFVNHRLMQLLANSGNNVLLKFVEADFSRMQSSGGGAYGADANTLATSKKSSLDLGGLNTPELAKMLLEREDGAAIPLVTHFYFIINDKKIEASKNSVEKFIGDDKLKDFKMFAKSNNIKWKNVDNLKLVLDYLSQQ